EWGLAGLALGVLLQRLGQALVLLMRSPLNEDVPGWLSDARGMRFFYDCPMREPFHVLWLKLGLLVSSDEELVARVVTMPQTVLVALGLYFFGKRYFGRMTAMPALWLFCLNPVVRYYGVSGLRDPLFAATVLWFALALFVSPAERGEARRGIVAGVLGALMV